MPHNNTRLWGEKPYHSLDYELKKQFGEKVYRIALNGGMTCPNRDGRVGTGGCIFCSENGSGDFAGLSSMPVADQLAAGKELLSRKRPIRSYIAYFQAYTNTYAPICHLEKVFCEAISDPDVKILSIATRPDCLGEDVLALLERLNCQKPVWVELGLQTIHPSTAEYIRRGYPLEVFDIALKRLRGIGVTVIVHVILYLPGETEQMMLETIDYLNRRDIQGIKLQLLHILKNTDLARDYLCAKNTDTHNASVFFRIPTMDEYIETTGKCLIRLSPDIVVHRLTGDGPKELLIAPLWSRAKRTVLNRMHQYFKEKDIWQGKEYYG